jgi:hypothetical protein
MYNYGITRVVESIYIVVSSFAPHVTNSIVGHAHQYIGLPATLLPCWSGQDLAHLDGAMSRPDGIILT